MSVMYSVIIYLILYIPLLIVWGIIAVILIKVMRRAIVALDDYIERNEY